MRILAGADFHGDRDVWQWFVGLASRCDVEAIVLAGDLLGDPEGFETQEQGQASEARALVDTFRSAGLPVFYIMGNDDEVELEAEEDRFIPLHGVRVVRGDYAFVGYQYSLPFMGGRHEKPEAEIATDLEGLAPLIEAGTVLVTHTPAHKILDSGILGRNIGSPSLRKLIDRRSVRAHIHGHSHSGFGRNGCHFNVASGRQRRAMIIDLRSMAHEVVEGVS